MEIVNNTSENLLRLCFTTKTRSRDFAIVYSYLLLSRFLELRQETSLKNKLIDKSYYNQYRYHSSLEMLLSTLPYQTIDDIAEKAMFNNGICNFLWMTSITSKDDSDQVVFYKFSKEFDVVIMLHAESAVKCFNNCSNFEPWIIRILKLEDKYYPCLINEQAYLPGDINIYAHPYLLPNKAKLFKFTESERQKIFSVFSSAFEKISNFIDKEHCFELVKSLNGLKNISNKERESVYSIIKAINLGGSCCKHDLACFECGIVHCKDCYLNHPKDSEYVCLCGQKTSLITLENLLARETVEDPVIKNDIEVQKVPTESDTEKNSLYPPLKVENENLPPEYTDSISIPSPKSKANINIEKKTEEKKLPQNSSSKNISPLPMTIVQTTGRNNVIERERTLPQKGNISSFNMNLRQISDDSTSSNDTNFTRKNEFQKSSFSDRNSEQPSYRMSSNYLGNSKEIQKKYSLPHHNELINTEYCSNVGSYKSKLIFSCWVCLNVYDVNTVYIMSCQAHYICNKCIIYTGDFCSICNNYFCRKCMHTILLNDCNVMNDGENNYHENCVSGL